MKKLATFLNDYVLECDWKDMALIKTCVCAFGVMLGLTVKKDRKKPIMILSSLIFLVTACLTAVRFVLELSEDDFEEDFEEDHKDDEEGFVMRIVAEDE